MRRQIELPRLGQRRCVRCCTLRVNHCAERLLLEGECPGWQGLRRKLIWLCSDCLPVYQALGLLVSPVRTTRHVRTDELPACGPACARRSTAA
jgi:hypothetical protein